MRRPRRSTVVSSVPRLALYVPAPARVRQSSGRQLTFWHSAGGVGADMYDITNPLAELCYQINPQSNPMPIPTAEPSTALKFKHLHLRSHQRAPLRSAPSSLCSTLVPFAPECCISHGHTPRRGYALRSGNRLIGEDPLVCRYQHTGVYYDVKRGYCRHTAHEPCQVLSYPGVISSRRAIVSACVLALSSAIFALRWYSRLAKHLVCSFRLGRINVLVVESKIPFRTWAA